MSVSTIERYSPEAWRGPDPRIVAAAAAGAVAIGLTLTDRIATSRLWPESGTSISGEVSESLVVGGLGEMGGGRVGETLAKHVQDPMCAVRYCNHGVSRKSLAAAAVEYYQRPSWTPDSRQTLVAHSMGLPLILNAIEEVVQNHPDVTVPEISAIHAISSPTCAEDTYMTGKLKLIGMLPSFMPSLSTKMVVGTHFAWRRAHDRTPQGERVLTLSNMWRGAGEVISEATDPLAPRTWFSMGRVLSKAGTYDDGVFDGIITPNTTIDYYYDPQDRVVKTRRALANLAKFATEYGAKVVPHETPGTGHANIEEIAPIIAQTMQDNRQAA